MNLILIMDYFQEKVLLVQLKNVKVILINIDMVLNKSNNKKIKQIIKKYKLVFKYKILKM